MAFWHFLKPDPHQQNPNPVSTASESAVRWQCVTSQANSPCASVKLNGRINRRQQLGSALLALEGGRVDHWPFEHGREKM